MALPDPRGVIFDLPGKGRHVTHHPSAVPAGPRPTVSVVVPCYNYGHFLDECVSSLVTQEHVDVDVIIIDDKSPDGSGEVADELARRHPGVVRSLRHEVNRGHIATYNEGLAAAEGEFVVLLDADDVITPGAFARATALMRANPSVGLTYGYPLSFTDVLPTLEEKPLRSWTVWSGHQWVYAQCRRGLSIVYSPEVVMRRSVQSRVGGFRPELPHAADLDCWLRIAAVSDIGRVNGPDQALRRVHSASMMQSGYGSVLADLRGRLDAYESFFSRDAGPLRDRHRLHELARRTTATEALAFVSEALQNQPEQADAATLDEYVQFAQQTYSDLAQTHEWRDYLWLRDHRGKHAAARARAGLIKGRRTLAGKYAWQRWYWQGD
ncbi:Glycosyl transferase family 2 [Frankineae bacterium MT45]|nr:Glycosyl transferase family 2 [Frankineae bacterium MT45]